MPNALSQFRLLVMLFVALGVFFGSGPSVAAQPVALTPELCADLDNDGDFAVSDEEAADLTADLTGDGAVDEADFTVAEAECGALLDDGGEEPVELTVEICAELDLDFSLHLTGEEAAALTVDLTGDGAVDAEDFAIVEAECVDLLFERGPPPFATELSAICRDLDIDGDDDVTMDEAAALTSDLTGNGEVDEADIALAAAGCDLLLSGPGGGDMGALVIVKLACTGIDRSTATVGEPGEALFPSDPSSPFVLPEGCEFGTATFEVTDPSGETIEVTLNPVSGGGPIPVVTGPIGMVIPTGEGTIVEVGTGIEATFEIAEGEETNVIFFNKVKDEEEPPVQQPPVQQPTTGGGTTGGGTTTGTTDRDCDDFTTRSQAQAVLDADRSDPNDIDQDNDGLACEDELPAATTGTTNTGPVVTTLPSTGHGIAGGTMVLPLCALSLAVLAVGVACRPRRTT
jgi:hypothetical protein